MTNQELMEKNKRRKIVQICYVTDDYMRTIKYLYDVLGYGPWKLLALNDRCTSNVRLNGAAITEPFAFQVALCMIGELQFEVIQPLYGPSVYDRFLKERGCGIHHIKERMTRLQIEERLAAIKRQGEREAFHGDGFQGLEDVDGFWYIDTYNALGAYYELGNCPHITLDPDQYAWWPSEPS